LVGGEFLTIDGMNRRNIARLNSNGSLDANFDPGSGPTAPSGLDPRIRVTALQADGNVVIGGGFTEMNGVKLNFLARLRGDQGGTVEFASAGPIVNEAGGSVVMAVNRTGSLAGPVSVNYATRDGSAAASVDYAPRSGVVVLNAGESSKSFAIPVLPDGLVEGDETFLVMLGNPIGGITLGARQTATVTIVDGSSPPLRFTRIARPGADQVQLTLTAMAGRDYVLQASTNLTLWSSIRTNTAVNSEVQFTEDGVSVFPMRFYRAFLP
jgi:hypothetical protein